MNIGIRDISEGICPFFIAGVGSGVVISEVICKENSQHSVNKSVF